MPHILDVFDADATELHDLRADPNTVIKIQGLVKEMLETNDNRRLGIFQQIVEEYGTFALPGVISATYVLGDQLSNKRMQQLLSNLLAELCADNPTAQSLLLRAGIVENPFNISRQIAGVALQQTENFALSTSDAEWLLAQVRRLVKEEEREAVLVIFSLLLPRSTGYKEALTTCTNWFRSEYKADAPAQLMNMLLQHYPDQTEVILTQLLESLERKDADAGRTIKEVVNLANPQVIPAAIHAASNRLTREGSGRMKAVEFLFEGAVARQIVNSATALQIGTQALEASEVHNGILRYWWQALSSAVKMNSEAAKTYFEQDLSRIQNDDVAVYGYLQLMFLASGPNTSKAVRAWAAQLLEDLKTQNAELYREAESTHERIISGQGTTGPMRTERRETGIR